MYSKFGENAGKQNTYGIADNDEYMSTKSAEQSYKTSRENDHIDSKYGFDRVKDYNERTGYLINMHSTEILDHDRRLVSALDLYFITMDASRFKVSVIYQPYFLVLPQQQQIHEVLTYLQRKYGGNAAKIEIIEKEDLDMPNHLVGIKHQVIKMSFNNTTVMNKIRLEINRAVKKNKDREKTNTFYMKMLSMSLTGNASTETNQDFLDFIMDIREHDVPYHVRVSIDLKIFCGLWYNIRCKGNSELPIITQRPDILDRPDPIVLAYDIETTKLPLKFPDAQTDQIMMISYMIDGQGYLITNREIVSKDVDDFEYTPKPEFEGLFIVFNEQNELAVIQRFFDHILEVRPHIIVSYNGDFFDWPFVETRAAFYDLDMKREIGYSKNRDGNYLSRPSMHMDCLCWVKRDSYLPVGSQGLKAVAKAKLRYNPVELDPEEMCKKAVESPQELASYSVSDAVATYYLYMKYVHPFIFALATIIPMEPDEVLRKGSGTLCESLLMKEAFHANIIFPNKEQAELNKLTDDGHVLDTETYVGGHVEALESGVFRADIPYRFRLDCGMLQELKDKVGHVLKHALEVEENIPLSEVKNFDEVVKEIQAALQSLHDTPNRVEKPVIYHLDVGAMYPNIILTNRLQPSAMVTEQDCAACDFNKPDADCKRKMDWLWRGEMLPATRSEFQRIQQQLETEKFPPLFPGGPNRAFHELSREDRAAIEKKRLSDYCRKAYKKTKITKLETRTATICQMENSFYVDTVRAFRDRRYEYKGLTKVAKAEVTKAVKSGDASEIKAAKGREVLYDSLQLAHKCILNSFYGYVMRKGARWHSMQMGGIVCLTGSNIITKAREVIEKVGRPLELDTDGIWCILPGTFPQDFEVETNLPKKAKITVSYPNAVLNTMVKDHFTNDQYHTLEKPAEDGKHPEYSIHPENSIFFEVDGPYLAMVLPAAKEEGKKLKKRYAVFNFDGSLAELKGFEIKRRGELQLIKIFQSQVFEAFLQGNTLEKCYQCVAKVANYWLDVLYSKGANMPDSELFELISENRSMSKKLEEYGAQKSTSISTAKRLAEFLGDQMVKDAGLACKYIISRKPEGAPVTERAIPLAIFQSEPAVRRFHIRKWLKDSTIDGDVDIRDILDWNYYIERIGGAIQKIITIPAALQGVSNPVPRVQHPDWLHKKVLEKNDAFKQRRINEIFKSAPKPVSEVRDIEDSVGTSSRSQGVPIVTTRKRTRPEESPETQHKTWREALGSPPSMGTTRDELIEWIKFQKKKWKFQLDQRKKMRGDNGNKRSKHDEIPLVDSIQKGPIQSLGGFLKRAQRNLIEMTWQIIQIVPIDQDGHYNLWAIIGDDLQKIKLEIPRIFYVNQRTPAPPCEDENDKISWKKVHRILPRSRPSFHLYQYTVPEKVFRDNGLGMLVDLAAPDIEGIYETQMSLEFRALMLLGCSCVVQRAEARKIAMSSTAQRDTFSLNQLEQKHQIQLPYLKNGGNLKKIFLYHHTIPSGKKSMWGLFLTPINKALIIVHDTVRTNQVPTMKNLYLTERQAYLSGNDDADEEKVPPSDIQFEVFTEIDLKQVYRHIQRALTGYQQEKKGPTIICVQSAIPLTSLNQQIPSLLDFPQTQIHIIDDASLLVGLEWQRNGVKSMVRHYLNHLQVFDLMLEQCRYFNLPIGNMPSDTVLFGADLFYARHLQKHNFVLWWSASHRPDLGGSETDDNTLLSEFDDNRLIQQNKAGFYPNVCVELTIDSLAVSALLQSHRIQEMEGANAAITFDNIPQASLNDMITNPNLLQMLPSYDETALCSSQFRIMRSLVGGWLREVTMNRNVYSDFQIVHFYRWIRSSSSLLYDPALRRSLNTLMKKLFLQIIAEFKVLGVDVIYADFTKIILHSGKKSIVDGISYADYICQSIRNKELFHSVHLSYQQCWNFLLWMDVFNYSGLKGKVPRELTGDTESEALDEDEEELALEMNWNICEMLPEEQNCQEKLESFLTLYIEQLADGVEPSKAIKMLSHHAYDIVMKMHQTSGRSQDGSATEFIKALCKILEIDPTVNDELDQLRKNMLRLVGLGEFSDKAIWQEKGKSYILSEVICQACNHCRDLDLLKDKHRAIKDGIPVWLCAQCSVSYDTEDIESRLIDVLNRKLMSYTLQDLQCTRCKEIKQDNMMKYCQCAGTYETLIQPIEIQKLFNTFNNVADNYSMVLLKEYTDTLLNNI